MKLLLCQDVEQDDPAEGSKSKRRKIRTQEYVYEPELEGIQDACTGLKLVSAAIREALLHVVSCFSRLHGSAAACVGPTLQACADAR